jgi:hypothetical protein
MAVVGRRDEQTAHTIALSDYRWVCSTDERSNSHMVLASSPACLFCVPMPDPLVDVPFDHQDVGCEWGVEAPPVGVYDLQGPGE